MIEACERKTIRAKKGILDALVDIRRLGMRELTTTEKLDSMRKYQRD